MLSSGALVRSCRQIPICALGCVHRLRASYAKSTVSQHAVSREEPVPPVIDHHVLLAARKGQRTTLPNIIKQYLESSGTVLDVCLPYESRPDETRRLTIGVDHSNEENMPSKRNVVTVAHCALVGRDHKITLSSGFALNVERAKVNGEMVIVTCAHTLEKIRQWPLLMSERFSTESQQRYSGSFIVMDGTPRNALEVYPISRVLSALPRSDLLLLSCSIPSEKLDTLPISPYPAHKDAKIQVHFVHYGTPVESGWNPWMGNTWRKWVQGEVIGYRDFAGRETQPGTYDALSHLFFTPLPTGGSSGGPIVDQESGAVVGVMLGTRMDNQIEGLRGWGVPSEAVFEMFSLPGLEGKN